MTIEDMNQFVNFMNEIDVTKFDIADQIFIFGAYTRFIEAIKPIYVKNAVKNPEINNFIIKL